jgi:hypothetical protein
MDDVQAFSQPSAEIFTNPESEQGTVSPQAMSAFLKYLEEHCDIVRDKLIDRDSGKPRDHKNIRSLFKKVTNETYAQGAKALLYKSLVHLRECKKKSKEEITVRQGSEKLTRRQIEEISEDAKYQLIEILKQYFAYAPISSGYSPIYAYYIKVPTQCQTHMTYVYKKLCHDTNQLSTLEVEFKQAANFTLGIGNMLRSMYYDVCEALQWNVSSIGGKWYEFLMYAIEELQGKNAEKWGSSVVPHVIPPLKDTERELREQCDIPGCLLPYPMPRTNHCETWNALLKRCSDPLLFLVWFSRLMTPHDGGRQALVLRGAGQTGTSALLDALQAILGDCYQSEPQVYNQFTNVYLAGALLVGIADKSDRYYLLSEEFKQRTGGDTRKAEVKHGKSAEIKLYSKSLITTNQHMVVNPLQRWSTSRVIMLWFEGIEGKEIRRKEEVVSELVEQWPFFIQQARLVDAAYSSRFKVNDVDIPITLDTHMYMRNCWDKSSSILYRWIHTNIVKTGFRATAKVLPGCDGTEDDHYEIHNFLSIDDLRKVVKESTKGRAQEFKQENLEQAVLKDALDYISSVFKVNQVNDVLVADNGNSVSVSGFQGIKMVENPVEVKKLPRDAMDKSQRYPSKELGLGTFIPGIYVGDWNRPLSVDSIF